MSVDAKLFVTCGKEMTVEVGNAVKVALDKYSRSKLDEFISNNPTVINRMHFLRSEEFKDVAKRFSNGVKIHGFDFNMFDFTFGNGDENGRRLVMFNGYSCDYDDTYAGDKIIFSIGCWGSSDEIMMLVAEAVKPFGAVYYDHNDCDDEDFIKLY